MSPLIGILDYGTGNISSIIRSFRLVGFDSVLVSEISHLRKVSSLVLPGVGHFGHAINFLRSSKLLDPTLDAIKAGMPILSICLGFHLLCLSSAESNDYPGLSLLPYHVTKIKPTDQLRFKSPHLGWNSVSLLDSNSRLFSGIDTQVSNFYFANRYGISSTSLSGVISTYSHETTWIASLEMDNLFSVQFHPEKSRTQGLTLMRNFACI